MKSFFIKSNINLKELDFKYAKSYNEFNDSLNDYEIYNHSDIDIILSYHIKRFNNVDINKTLNVFNLKCLYFAEIPRTLYSIFAITIEFNEEIKTFKFYKKKITIFPGA